MLRGNLKPILNHRILFLNGALVAPTLASIMGISLRDADLGRLALE
jgi:hypothetical protein